MSFTTEEDRHYTEDQSQADEAQREDTTEEGTTEAPVTDEAHEDAVTREDEADAPAQESVQIREGAQGKDGERLGWSGNRPKAGPAMTTTTVRDGGEALFEHHV